MFESYSLIELIIIIGIGVFLLLGAVITTFIISYRRTWNYKYIDFEKVSGFGYVPTKKGRCKLIKISDGGEELFYIKNQKKYRTAYGKRIGINYIAWAIGKDGYARNINFDDLDERLEKLGVFPVEKDMRYANASIRKIIDRKFDDRSFMDKWGTMIAFILLLVGIVLSGAFIYIMGDKLNEGIKINGESMKTANDVMTKVDIIVTKLDTVNTGGSGVKKDISIKEDGGLKPI